MKTIFRYTNIALLIAAIFAVGAVVTYAQDPCTDAEGQAAANDKIQALFKDKTIPGRKAYVAAGKAFLEKYGACDSAKDLSDYLKPRIPQAEETIRKMEEQAAKDALVGKFDSALKAKNWDVVYASGKEILAKYPDEFRTVEIVLGTIGGEEAFNANFKYSDDAVKYSKLSIADLESGKPFDLGGKPRYGLGAFEFLNKNDAIGWLNLYIGYITQVAKKDKAGAGPYLYKATQSASDAAKNSVSFELIGSYYFDELNKVVEQIQTKAKDQKDTDPPDVAQKKVDEIKALVAMSNGISERAMDAFSRAYTLGKDAAYKKKMKDNVVGAYKVRFAKEVGVDEWIATALKKPFVNPTTPVAPVSDPEPVASTPSGNGTGGAGVAPKPVVTTTPPAKPVTTPAKPATAPPAKPAAKPRATLKKAPVKKRAA